MTDVHPLDNPAWHALAGPQAAFARRKGRALRFDPDVCPFFAMPDDPGPQDWADLAALAGPGGTVTLAASMLPFPDGWSRRWAGPGVQLVAGEQVGREVVPDPEIVRLGPADAGEALALAERARPGPFRIRTLELGGYLGIRRGGALVAMAGERLRLPGYAEISAVCTDAAWRGRGLASRLTLAVAAAIRARGEVPFLHAVAANTTAISLYERLGFAHRRATEFKAAQPPG